MFKRACLLGVCGWIMLAAVLGTRVSAGQRRRPVFAPRFRDQGLATLKGNTRPEAIKENDIGIVDDNFRLEHMWLELRRSREQERDIEEFIEQLHDPSSPNFHYWLTAKEFGQRFGVAEEEILAITDWLRAQNFEVNGVYPNRIFIDFSGTAGQVRQAFHTEIHHLAVHGKKHYANVSDPKIPVTLAAAVVGIVSLHDFRPRPLNHRRAEFTVGGGNYLVVPADLSTIYNLNPVFAKGYSGQGQTIVVLENTNVYSAADWTTFRTKLGLSSYTSGSFTQVHPPSTGMNNCVDPGVVAGQLSEFEAILDAEWASAAAPSAAIQLASCADTSTAGIFIALQNIPNAGSTPPAIISISYGSAEVSNGAAGNSAISALYQQAVTEGVSIFASSGDQGAAVNDYGATTAANGINFSGLASTPYNVAVGGADFGDTYAGTNSTYWNASNTATFGSALSYIPEIPWNDSCASSLLATFTSGGGTTTYGSSGFCNNVAGATYVAVVGGSGGPSACASGAPTNINAVSGTCAGFAKPSWQTVFGNPNDGVRDVPDVSLFAATGVWGHCYVICMSDTGNGGASCAGTPDTWSCVGGTSVSSPVMAGIQSLVNQAAGTRFGNPNPNYYTLAAAQYGMSGDTTCNSTLGNTASSSCIFYDVTQGDMGQPCRGVNCYLPSGTNGVLSAAPQALTSVIVTALGSGYASPPTCALAGGGGTGATCSATLTGVVSSLILGNGGSGYTSAPSCAITSGGGSGATCSATISAGAVFAVNLLTFGGGYTSTPTCLLTGSGGSAATCTAVTITGISLSLTAPGSGFIILPNCTLTGGGGSGATCTGVAINSATANQPAFTAATGWDFATGIGSVNAYNLAAAMSNGQAGLTGGGASFAAQTLNTTSSIKSLTLANIGLSTLTITASPSRARMPATST